MMKTLGFLALGLIGLVGSLCGLMAHGQAQADKRYEQQGEAFLPCPKCGDSPDHGDFADGYGYFAACFTCDEGLHTGDTGTYENAVDEWNKLVREQQSRKES